MSLALLNLYDGALSGSLATVYTVPSLTKAVIHAASFCNSTAGVVALTVKITPRAAGTARTVVSAKSLAAGETYLCPELINQVLEAGGLLAAFGLNIEAVVSGRQVVGA